jgi:hypothetical protein
MASLVLIAVVGAFATSAIAGDKGRSVFGFCVFGLLLLVPALIVVLKIEPEPTSSYALHRRS